MARRVQLVPVQPGYPTLDRVVAPGDKELVIGRVGGDLVIPALVISGRHGTLKLTESGRGVTVKDLSRNGMSITPRNHRKAVPIGKDNTAVAADGDTLTIVTAREVEHGVISYRVLISDPPASVPLPVLSGPGRGTKRSASKAGVGGGDGGEEESDGSPASGGGGGGRGSRPRVEPPAQPAAATTNTTAELLAPNGIFSPTGASSSAASGGRGAGAGGAPVDDAHDAAAPARLRDGGLVVITDRRFEQDFRLGAKVNEGGFAEVFRAVEIASGKLFAAKKVDKRKYNNKAAGVAHAVGAPDISALHAEVQILHSIRHQHVVRLYQVYDEPAVMWIVQEFINGGEVFDKVISKKRFEEHKARGLLRQIFEGVAYLHARGIVHRDLKPENILLQSCVMEHGKLVPVQPPGGSPPAGTGGSPATRSSTMGSTYSSASGGSATGSQAPQITYVAKIADFGLAKLGFEESGPVGSGGRLGGKLKSAVGTEYYIAPELAAIEYRRDTGGGSTAEARAQLMSRRQQLLSKYAAAHPAVVVGAASPEAAASRMAASFTPAAVDECLQRAENGYDAACDCWSLGVIAFVLLSGRMPFFEEKDRHAPPRPMPLLVQHLARFADFDDPEHWKDVSEQAKDFVRRLLDPNPRTRLTAADALKHPWLARRSGGGGGGGASGGGGGGGGSSSSASSSSSGSSAAGSSSGGGGDGPAAKRARKG